MLKNILKCVGISVLMAALSSYAIKPFSFTYLFCFFATATLNRYWFHEKAITVKKSFLFSMGLFIVVFIILALTKAFIDELIGFIVFQGSIIVFGILYKIKRQNHKKIKIN